MSGKQLGMTLIELIVAIVIISIGVAGVLLAFNTTVRSSADPMVSKQMLAIAEEMMEEIQLQPFAQPVGGAQPGSITGCDRSQADNIDDYSGYTDQPVCTLDGSAIDALTGYVVSVVIDGDASLGGLGGGGAKKLP